MMGRNFYKLEEISFCGPRNSSEERGKRDYFKIRKSTPEVVLINGSGKK